MQRRFETMQHLRPPKPTIRTENVAKRIAERIVEEVNLDDVYWEPHEIPDRVWDVQQEIMRHGYPASVFERLHRRQPPVSCSGERGTHPYGWEGIDDHCAAIGDVIAQEELNAALKAYEERYA